MKPFLWLGALLLLVSCGSSQDKNPQLFLPTLYSPTGANLTALKARYCSGLQFRFDENFLTPETFNPVFNCANYDGSLDSLRALFTNRQFTPFLKNLNLVLSSKGVGDLKETLRSWLEEGPEGTSRVDRLLPTLADIFKNPALQDGLPVIRGILEAGETVWRELLPGLSRIVYQERFQDNFEDISYLFRTELGNEKKDYAKTAKDWADFLSTKVDGKTVSLRGLELADRLREIRLRDSTIPEYLDKLNETGVFVNLYLDSGSVRGEKIDPKLNADPEEDEIREGLSLTPEERQDRAYRKLFRAGDSEDAPIVQLTHLVEEFHRSHPDFVPGLARWFSANGDKVAANITEYVVRAQTISALPRLSLETYLVGFAREKGLDLQTKLDGKSFQAFLQEALHAESFNRYLAEQIYSINKDQFGERNAEQLKHSSLQQEIFNLYGIPAVAEFGATISPDRPLPLASLAKRFSNLHRGEKLKVEYAGETKTVDLHLIDIWWSASKTSLGEGVVTDFAVKLAQTLFTQVADDISKKDTSLSEWYYSSPYSNPGTTESIAGYAVKELDLLKKYYKHKEYFKGQFAEEAFPDENDRRAFRLLVDQVPNIWTYIKSGMARSGNDLTRAMASKDEGFLTRRYVDLLASGYNTGWIRDGVRLVQAYHEKFPAKKSASSSGDFKQVRRISKGADALKRVLRSLFEPEQEENYDSSTLGRILVPASALVSEARRPETEKFLLTACSEVKKASDKTINDFLGSVGSGEVSEADRLQRRERLKSASELLADPIFPDILREVSSFFKEDAVKPALDYFAKKIDDGSLLSTLKMIRRLLGFRG